ncbi:hypothetical protein ACOTFR_29075, partial [Achromobacter xylosoxidans]
MLTNVGDVTRGHASVRAWANTHHWKVGLYLSGIPPCHRCSHEDSFFVTGVVNDDYWASDSLGRIDGA